MISIDTNEEQYRAYRVQLLPMPCFLCDAAPLVAVGLCGLPGACAHETSRDRANIVLLLFIEDSASRRTVVGSLPARDRNDRITRWGALAERPLVEL